jgi:hypothetical protein
MACADCGHGDHGTSPCQTCALAGQGTCWQRSIITGGDGVRTAASRIDLATGKEENPCFLCRSFEKSDRRLREYFASRGLTPLPDGSYETPIAKDFKGRKSLRIHPQNYGWCRRDAIATDILATCLNFTQVRTASEMESRIKL